MKPVIWRDEFLTLKDGIKLASRLWTPKEGGPWPALLMRQPYGREIASTVTYLHPTWWASHGYLVIIQDVRGQGGSGGNFKGFQQEAIDTTQTHRWVRSLQECNGLLGTFGFSYQGFTQLVAEPNTPPPDCLAPAMTGLKENEHWSCHGGAFWWHLGLAWGLQLAALRAQRNKDLNAWGKLRQSLEDKSYLREGPRLLAEFDPEGMANNWLTNSNQSSPTWLIHTPLETWLSKPMLLIGGWWDPHLTGIIDLYKKSINSGGSPELHIGPASHLHWWEESQNLLLNFFNTHLQQVPPKKDLKPKQRLWNLTKHEWQEKIDAENCINHWGLSSNGSACIDSKEGTLHLNKNGKGLISIVHDPWRPVPAIGGHLSPHPGEVDRSELDMRSDIAVFTSPKLINNIHLEGTPILAVTANADKEGFDLCIAISIVDPNQDNKATQISTGFLRVLGKDAKEPLKRQIFCQPLLADLTKDTRLRISIAGSAWPAIGINPGDRRIQCGSSGIHCQVITINLKLSDSNFHISPLISQKL